MTLAEVTRAIESKRRIQKLQAQEKASFDYILAETIGRSIARIYSSTAHMPQLNEVYPSLFDSDEIEERKKAKQTELSAIRFKMFTQSFNKRFKEVAKDE